MFNKQNKVKNLKCGAYSYLPLYGSNFCNFTSIGIDFSMDLLQTTIKTYIRFIGYAVCCLGQTVAQDPQRRKARLIRHIGQAHNGWHGTPHD